MWKCPVCDQENNAATVCPACGYDRTCDYEQYPTAFAVTAATPTHILRRQWQAKQGPALADLIADWYDAPQDPAAAEHCFRRLADGGDPAARYWLGVAYAQGRSAEKDQAQAVEWFGQSAQQGYARAQYQLGLCFQDGAGMDADPRKALDCFRKAAEQGYPPARHRLEELETQMPDQLFARYQQEPNQTKRMEYLKKAADLGYTPAQAELSDCYYFGRGVETDHVKAEWYRQAAGQPPRQAETPQQLFERYRQESDQAKRMEYLKKAAEQGYAPAQCQLGECYLSGRGVEKNEARAAEWYRKAADQGDAEAQAAMARCCSEGWGVEKNAAEAARWFQRLAQQNNSEA